MRFTRFGGSLLLASLLMACNVVTRSHAQEAPPKTFAESFQSRMAEKDIDGAAKLIEDASDLKPESLAQFRIQLGALMMRERRTDEALTQFNTALEATYAKLEDGSNPRLFAIALPTAAMMLRQSRPEQADQWIERGLATLGSKLDSEKLSDNHSVYSQIMRMKLNTPNKDEAEQAKRNLLEFVAKCERIYAGQSEPSASTKNILDVWNDLLPVADDEQSAQLFDKIQSLAQSQWKESPSSAILQAYTTAVAGFVSRNARTAPELAGQTLSTATAFIDAIESDDENLNRVRESFGKTSERLTKSIESALAVLAMIGKPAPAIDPMEWVNGEPETLESLKGKVVLLDFWAVWCGPCIATFPHLKHLDAEYGPKGLAIIGVTRQYNFHWDPESSNATRAKDPVSLEDEMAMLQKFIAKHELTHRTMVTPEESKMQSEYQVTGIPHAVLLDKQGNVRLVKIGSGSKNAEEIEAMVQTLLAE